MILQLNSRGQAVELLQRLIQPYDPEPHRMGFVDGLFGPRTQQALVKFTSEKEGRGYPYADDAFQQRWGISAALAKLNPGPVADIVLVKPQFSQAMIPAPTGISKREMVAWGVAGVGLLIFFLADGGD